MQKKLDRMLADCISRFEELGFEHYPIAEHVRITNNKTVLGSAKDVNGAFIRTRGVRNSTRLASGELPLG